MGEVNVDRSYPTSRLNPEVERLLPGRCTCALGCCSEIDNENKANKQPKTYIHIKQITRNKRRAQDPHINCQEKTQPNKQNGKNVKIAKWEESSKSLNILLNSQMSSHDKNGLGYGTQLNEMSDKSEISMSVFEVRSSDEESTPANDRFSKADGYHAVPPPITGNYLTRRADISFAGLDEYVIRKKC
ncbi:hypothetical protein Tco_0197834 [Tanacetum coccineum]